MWTVVSAFDAMTVRPAADDDLIEQATCYSDNSGQYEECLKARADGRLSGHEVLKPPLLTPYRVSLCATLQARFSRSEFWDCVKALSDPLQ